MNIAYNKQKKTIRIDGNFFVAVFKQFSKSGGENSKFRQVIEKFSSFHN